MPWDEQLPHTRHFPNRSGKGRFLPCPWGAFRGHCHIPRRGTRHVSDATKLEQGHERDWAGNARCQGDFPLLCHGSLVLSHTVASSLHRPHEILPSREEELTQNPALRKTRVTEPGRARGVLAGSSVQSSHVWLEVPASPSWGLGEAHREELRGWEPLLPLQNARKESHGTAGGQRRIETPPRSPKSIRIPRSSPELSPGYRSRAGLSQDPRSSQAASPYPPDRMISAQSPSHTYFQQFTLPSRKSAQISHPALLQHHLTRSRPQI